ncbi:hypothetical protein [Methanobacterium sp.]|jgi:hypothetical protein|uniref:hypothetical protein n=1 Tax=Methanobacterium sp. TaxID=2164 RepID=UPI003158EE8C
MKNKHSKNKEENPLKELDKIKVHSFKELEHEYFNDMKFEDFQKERLKEFDKKELKDFKEFVEDSKMDSSLENLKLELNSDDTIKNILKELKDIGINGKRQLKIITMLKKEIQK